jgi:hypothetical protein
VAQERIKSTHPAFVSRIICGLLPSYFNGKKVLYLARLVKAFPSILLNVRRIVILSTLSSTLSTIRLFAAVIYYIVLLGLL